MDSCPNCRAFVDSDDNYCGQCKFELKIEKLTPLLTNQEIKVDDVRSKLADVYFKMGKVKEALKIFENNLDNNPNDYHAKEMIDIIKKEQTKTTDGKP